MERKVIFTAEMRGSAGVLQEMADLRDANNKLTNEQKVRQKAEQEGIEISKQEKIEFERRAVQIKENSKQINELTKAYQGQEQKVLGLRPKLTQLTKTMQELRQAGKEGTDEFKKMQKEAGALRDSIDKTNAEVKFFSDDLAGLRAGTESLGAISAGFQVVTGVMALAGVESEAFERNIQRLAGVMAVTNGLQQVANALRKESAVRMGATLVLTKAKAAAMWVAVAAQTAWTGAIKLFSKAVYNIPVLGWLLAIIGAIITAIALMIKHWEKVTTAIMKAVDWMVFWKDLSKKAVKETEELTEAVDTLSEALENKNKKMLTNISNIEHELKLMKAQGASISELTAKERELLEEKVKASRFALTRLMMDKEATDEQKEQARLAVQSARRELEIFEETQKTKTRIAKEEAAKRLKEERETQIQAELALIAQANAEYLTLEQQLEAERRRMNLENYENRKLQRQAERDEILRGVQEYKGYMEQQRQSELSEFQKREEQYRDWLRRKAVTQEQFNALMNKVETDRVIYDQKLQAQRMASSLSATATLIGNVSTLMGAQGKAAKWMQGLALAEAAVNFGVGLSATMRKGLPLSVPFVIGFAAQAAGILAGIRNLVVPQTPKFAKGGIIGGKPHSSGGTTFQGSDGSRFEAERGEYLAIVNKRDAARAAMLDTINQKHGAAFGTTSGYFARGGVQMPQPRTDFERVNMDDVIRETVDAIISIPVTVSERDITDTQRRVSTYERAGNL